MGFVKKYMRMGNILVASLKMESNTEKVSIDGTTNMSMMDNLKKES